MVNATGVWADDVRALDEAAHPHSIRPAKGIHVTVPRSKLPADIAAVIPVPKDRRSIFVVPWPDGDDVYLGTTDTDWDGPLDDPRACPTTSTTSSTRPTPSITEPLGRDDITGVWAGLRPLLGPGRGTPRERAHRRPVAPPHRARLAPRPDHGDRRQAHHLPAHGRGHRRRRRQAPRAPAPRPSAPVPDQATRHPGAAGLDAAAPPGGGSRGSGLDEDVFAALVGRHGGETPAVLDLASGRPELLEPLVPGLPYLRAEALWAVRHEMAMTVDDVLARRTRSASAPGPRRGRGGARRRRPARPRMGTRPARRPAARRPPSPTRARQATCRAGAPGSTP